MRKGFDFIGRKGLSPLVAAVMLIVVTMTIAALLAFWASQYVLTSLPEQNQTQMEAECRFAGFNIFDCIYRNSTDSINLILENTEGTELRDMRVYLIFPNGTVSEPRTLPGALSSDASLKSYVIDDVYDSFSRLRVTTHCPRVIEDKSCTMI